jgi:NadR type nicotinamide-nucleotide adenylyltransferase
MAVARRVGVSVGKFNPPHLGHAHLISTGAAEVDAFYVLLCDRPDQTIPAETRAEWLSDAAPDNVSMLITPDDLPQANEPWAARALEVLPEPPTLAVTSEAWGDGWAAAMGAAHLLVDLDRSTHNISGTALRSDIAAGFDQLVPAARSALARRVVVLGAESTGKSTLAEALGHELSTVWVPEHGRWYWEGRRHLADQTWTTDEFRRIAAAQRRLEEDLARKATRGLLVADTDALVTAVWHERYLGEPDPVLDEMASTTPPDLYLICDDEIPWSQDGTRESKADRRWMQEAMTERANASGAAVAHISGAPAARLERAVEAIRPLTIFERFV